MNAPREASLRSGLELTQAAAFLEGRWDAAPVRREAGKTRQKLAQTRVGDSCHCVTPLLRKEPGGSELSILETPAPAGTGAAVRAHSLTALRAPRGTSCDKDQPRANVPLSGDPAVPSGTRSFVPIRGCGTSKLE